MVEIFVQLLYQRTGVEIMSHDAGVLCTYFQNETFSVETVHLVVTSENCVRTKRTSEFNSNCNSAGVHKKLYDYVVSPGV